MIDTSHTRQILCRYLQALSVRVSRDRVERLLHTPVGGSLRGISDALDALGVENAVYQLPSADYFSQLEAPFIAMLRTGSRPFRVVTQVTETAVEVTDGRGKARSLPVAQFLSQWTGTVLVGDTTEKTVSDAWYRWKDIGFAFGAYKGLWALILGLLLVIGATGQQGGTLWWTAYLGLLAVGMVVSAAILYKEHVDGDFLERFCHIGQAVDCNRVLHSQGATLLGVGLGEWAMFYFSVLFFLSLLCPWGAYGWMLACCVAALGFTLYSLIYQFFILRKGCMLCMCVNGLVWGQAVVLYLLRDTLPLFFTWQAAVLGAGLAGVALLVGLSLRNLWQTGQECRRWRSRTAGLWQPEVFRQLLALEPQAGDGSPCAAALQSGEEPVVTIVTNPTCGNCAREHRHIRALARQVPVALVLVNYPRDRVGAQVSQAVIAAYRAWGWERAMKVLQRWFDRRQLDKEAEALMAEDSVRIWQEQQAYCRKGRIDRTPVAVVDGHYVPELYTLDSLSYVLT